MATAILEGFDSIEHAEMFINWFEGQGEQDMYDWFDCNGEYAPSVDVEQKYVKTEETIIARVKYPDEFYEGEEEK